MLAPVAEQRRRKPGVRPVVKTVGDLSGALRGSVRLALNQDALDIAASAEVSPHRASRKRLTQRSTGKASASPLAGSVATRGSGSAACGESGSSGGGRGGSSVPGMSEVAMVRTELKALGVESAAEAARLSDVTQTQDGLVASMGQLTGENHSADLRLAELTRSLANMGESYAALTSKRDVQEHERRSMAADISSMEDYVAEFRSWIEMYQRQIDDTGLALEDEEDVVEELEAEIEDISRELHRAIKERDEYKVKASKAFEDAQVAKAKLDKQVMASKTLMSMLKANTAAPSGDGGDGDDTADGKGQDQKQPASPTRRSPTHVLPAGGGIRARAPSFKVEAQASPPEAAISPGAAAATPAALSPAAPASRGDAHWLNNSGGGGWQQQQQQPLAAAAESTGGDGDNSNGSGEDEDHYLATGLAGSLYTSLCAASLDSSSGRVAMKDAYSAVLRSSHVTLALGFTDPADCAEWFNLILAENSEDVEGSFLADEQSFQAWFLDLFRLAQVHKSI